MTGDSAATQGPSEVASAFFRAYELRDWEGVAELTHHDSLAQLRNAILEEAAIWRALPSVREMYPPDTHPAVLEHAEQWHARAAKHGNPILREMSVGTLEELAALSPRDALIRSLQGSYDPPEQYINGRGPVRTRRAIGVVDETEQVSHVVYRLHTDRGQYREDDELLVISARRTKQAWRIILNSEVSNRRGGKVDVIAEE